MQSLRDLGSVPGLKVVHLNVRSLISKMDQLRMDLPKSGIDIFSLSETWLGSQTEDRLTSMPYYNFIRLDRETKRPNGDVKQGGGLGIYYKQDLHVDFTSLSHLNRSNCDIEMQWVIVIRPNTRNIILVNVYRPPDGCANEAYKALNDTLMVIKELHKYELLILGDFNTDYQNSKLAVTKLAKTFAVNHDLSQVITETTRHSSHTKTTIDLAFTNIRYCTKSGVLNYNVSDHKPIYIVKKKLKSKVETTVYTGRSYRGCSHEDLVEHLNNVNTEDLLRIQDPNLCWAELHGIITNAADALCPLHEIQIRVNTAPYLTSELLELQKDREYFVQKADLSRDPGDRFIANCMIKKTRLEVRRAKSNYHKTQVMRYRKNPRKFWIEINRIESENQTGINSIVNDDTGELIPPDKLPQKINDYFTGIGPKLAKAFPNIRNEDKKYKPKLNKEKYELSDVSTGDIKYTLSDMSQYKSSGLDNLGTAFLMSAISILDKEFTYLYNQIILLGIFPDAWKVASVTPIPKVAIPKVCGELRPISILPLPGRLLEKIINSRMQAFLEKTKYFEDNQFGFRRNKSTTQALAALMDKILLGMDGGEYSVTLFLDFKKAFDTVDHKVLIWKIQRAGFGPNTQRLLLNYLTGRKQLTKVNHISSTLNDICTGVPQGSTLGPLLFVIYVNDFPLISRLPLFTQFADDTTITLTGKDIDWIESELNKILVDASVWFVENKLTLNPQKTEYVIFTSKINRKKFDQIKLVVGQNILRETDHYKYLGTILDSTMSIEPQLSKLNQLMALRLKTFRTIRRYMTEKTAVLVYKVTILPIMDYNDIVYPLLTSQQLTKIQRLQNKALRTIYFGKNLGTDEMHTRAKLEYLVQRRDNHVLSLMMDRSVDPNYIDYTERRTRQGDAVLLKLPQAQTNKFTKSPLFRGGTMWNGLPTEVRKATTRLELKTLVRRHRADSASLLILLN